MEKAVTPLMTNLANCSQTLTFGGSDSYSLAYFSCPLILHLSDHIYLSRFNSELRIFQALAESMRGRHYPKSRTIIDYRLVWPTIRDAMLDREDLLAALQKIVASPEEYNGTSVELTKLGLTPMCVYPDAEIIGTQGNQDREIFIRNLSQLIIGHMNSRIKATGNWAKEKVNSARSIADLMESDMPSVAGLLAVPYIRPDRLRINEKAAITKTELVTVNSEETQELRGLLNEKSSELRRSQSQILQLEHNIDLLKKDVQRYRGEIAALRDVKSTVSEDEVIRLRHKVQFLEAQMQDPDLEDEDEIVIPDSWDALETFEDRYLRPNVVLSEGAIRAARKSPFENISRAYECLLWLAREYAPACRGDGERPNIEGMRVGKVGSALDHSKYREDYICTHEGKRYVLDRHIALSNSRDQRFCLRVYFAIVEPKDAPLFILVGHLPGHLKNSMS